MLCCKHSCNAKVSFAESSKILLVSLLLSHKKGCVLQTYVQRVADSALFTVKIVNEIWIITKRSPRKRASLFI